MSSFNDVVMTALADLGFDQGSINDRLFAYLRSEGFTGSLNDMWLQYLNSQGFGSGSLDDRMFAYLGDLGYTGSLNDRLFQAWKDQVVLGTTFEQFFTSDDELFLTSDSEEFLVKP
jgi:hypothetical protein